MFVVYDSEIYLFPLSVSQEVLTGVVYSLTALYIVSMTIFGGITAVLCWKIHTLKQKGNPLVTLYPSVCTSKRLMHTLALLLILGIHEDVLCTPTKFCSSVVNFRITLQYL